jgi:hypothetical protein
MHRTGFTSSQTLSQIDTIRSWIDRQAPTSGPFRRRAWKSGINTIYLKRYELVIDYFPLLGIDLPQSRHVPMKWSFTQSRVEQAL